MRHINKCILYAVLVATPVFAQERIEVFTDTPTQIENLEGVDVVYYDLSAPERIKNQFAPKLPADEKIALAQAKRFFETAEGRVYQLAMRDAYRGRQKMMQYQLTKIPAIVFDDGKYVIYGSTDLAQATMLYRAHLEARQEQH
jgi:integrating conjugative element protein (TIGR03757 family)